MPRFTFTKPGVSLIENSVVPIRYVTDIGRIDVIDDRLIVTLYDLHPGDENGHEAVVVDRVGISIANTPSAVQFVVSVLAQIGWKVISRKPLMFQ